MTRIFLVSGPSQLLFLSAALAKDAELDTNVYTDILVFTSVSYPKEKKEICKTIAKTVWEWSDIIWLIDIDYYECSNKSKVISTILNVEPYELWLCMPYGKVETEFQKCYYDSSIVRYDDGLGTYVMPNTLLGLLKTPSLFKKQLKMIGVKWKRSIEDTIKLKRMSLPKIIAKKRFGLFASFVGDTSKGMIQVDWSYLRTQLDKFHLKGSDEVLLEGKTCLIIGQYFSLLGFFDRQEELGHYIELCQSLYKEGYKILWKEHPKNSEPFFNDLKATFKEIENFNDYHSSYWPLEIVVKDFNIDLFIATTSTSIVVLDRAFGYTIKSSASMMINNLQGADREVAEILLKNLNKEQLVN
jgi:hypothetical protein